MVASKSSACRCCGLGVVSKEASQNKVSYFFEITLKFVVWLTDISTMVPIEVEDSLRRKYRALKGDLDEKGRRHWAAAEARELGHGGITAVTRATGLSAPTIRRGLRELAEGTTSEEGGKEEPSSQRIRREGACRKRCPDADPGLVEALERLVDPEARGDPT